LLQPGVSFAPGRPIKVRLNADPLPEQPGHVPVYNWFPTVLANANASAEYCAFLLQQHIASSPSSEQSSLIDWIKEELVVRRLGITDANDAELAALAAHPELATNLFAHMVSVRAHIGWSTHGHSAVDVNIYSSGGAAAEQIRGNVENTDVGKFLSEYLEVDVEEITRELEEKLKSAPGPKQVGVLLESDADGHPAEWFREV
jgi:alkaline phosphatase